MRRPTTVGLRNGLISAGILAAVAGLAAAQEPVGKSEGAKPTAGAKKPATIYDKSADARVQVAKAAERARHDDRRILLMFGGDWRGWCHKLHGLFRTNHDVANILGNEYVLVMIDLESPNARPLLEECKAALGKDDLQKDVGYPFLAVLDSGGKVVTAQRTDLLEEGDHHDPKKVADFLSRWKVPQRDAKSVLAEALARASLDDKRVLLTFGAPWCSWCHKLHDWLARPEVAAILDRDFVVAKVDIDRMAGGKELMKSYRAETSSGIPWYAIFDVHGKSLASADYPGGNICFPLRPQEIDRFFSTIKGQARRIDERQLGLLRKSLDENADRIWKDLGLGKVPRT